MLSGKCYSVKITGEIYGGKCARLACNEGIFSSFSPTTPLPTTEASSIRRKGQTFLASKALHRDLMTPGALADL